MSLALGEDFWRRPIWPQPQRAVAFTDAVTEPVTIVRPVVSPSSTASPPQWLDATMRRMQELFALGPNWDSRGSAAVRKDVLSFVYSMLGEVMAPSTVAPSILPLGHGGVQLLWESPSTEIEAEIARPNQIAVYQIDKSTGAETEWQATTELTGLRDLLRSGFTR